MSKGGGKTVNTVQKADPWEGQQPYLRDVFNKSINLANLGAGSNVAAQSPNTKQYLEQLAGNATNPNSLSNQGANEFSKTIGGDYLNPDSNPYLKGAVNTAMNDVQGRVAGTFGTRGGNNYGSSAHQEWLGRSLMDAAAPIYAQNYQTERGRQLNAAQLAPQMDAGVTGQLGQAGQAQDAYQQRLTDSPWDILQRYQQNVNGNYGQSSTGSSPYYGASPLASAAGLGLSGMGIYSLGQGAGLWGAAGGGLGGLAGAGGAGGLGLGEMMLMSSDRRLKREIERVGTHESGLPVYSFKYLNDEKPRLGFMADEVEKVMPEAVVTDERGYKMVKYGMLEA